MQMTVAEVPFRIHQHPHTHPHCGAVLPLDPRALTDQVAELKNRLDDALSRIRDLEDRALAFSAPALDPLAWEQATTNVPPTLT
jgi:hypothetical protein